MLISATSETHTWVNLWDYIPNICGILFIVIFIAIIMKKTSGGKGLSKKGATYLIALLVIFLLMPYKNHGIGDIAKSGHSNMWRLYSDYVKTTSPSMKDLPDIPYINLFSAISGQSTSSGDGSWL